jgi:hypothetical protein
MASLELDGVGLALILVHVHVNMLHNIGTDGGRENSGKGNSLDDLSLILGGKYGYNGARHALPE